jgi:hypothetical protein
VILSSGFEANLELEISQLKLWSGEFARKTAEAVEESVREGTK